MIATVEQYLNELKRELEGSDRATIQDALSDAEEYLRTALGNEPANSTGESPSVALGKIIERYGQPVEVAAAYKEVGQYVKPVSARAAAAGAEPMPQSSRIADSRPWYRKFFGIFAEPGTWGALLYLVFSLATGILYFTWVVTGLSLSIGFLVLIIGIPIAGVFLLSVRGIAVLEGRMVEALLGVRMPRRPLFSRHDISWWQKMKDMLVSRHTWTSIIYLILHLPLGIIYFTVTVTLLAVSLWLVLFPLLQLGFGLPLAANFDSFYYLAWWMMPIVVITGILLLTASMHAIKALGRLQANFAKIMLVRE